MIDERCPACGKVGEKVRGPFLAIQKEALYICMNREGCRVVQYLVKVK